MMKKICIVGVVICCVVLSGCTVRTKEGEMYIDVDEKWEKETYHFAEKEIEEREKFSLDANVGEIDLGVSDETLYDLTAIVRYEKDESPQPPEITDKGDVLQISAGSADLSGTVADAFNALEVELNVGEIDLSLQSGRFERVDVDLGVGEVKMYLPETGEGTIHLYVDTGDVNLVISGGRGYLLHYDIDIGSLSLDVDNTKIEKGTYRINPDREIAYEIWVSVDIGAIEVIE
jgi:hypothetical protein